MPLGELGIGLEGGEEPKVALGTLVLVQATTDQLQSRTQLRLRQLVHQLVQFLTHDAHADECKSYLLARQACSGRPMSHVENRVPSRSGI